MLKSVDNSPSARRPFAWIVVLLVLLVAAAHTLPVAAQQADGLDLTVEGAVRDSSGAKIAGALVTLMEPGGTTKTATTGLDGLYRFDGLAPGTVTVSVSSQGLRPAERTVTIENRGATRVDFRLELSVVAEEITVSEYLSTYAPRITRGATKTEMPLVDVPQSIQSVPEEVIEDQQVWRSVDVVRNVSNVVAETGNSGTMDGYYIRGFISYSPLKNGFRRERFGGIADVSNLERVEVIKGPSSLLYGQGALGGVVNLITKKATAEPVLGVELAGSTDSLFRGALDLGGPILTDRLYYRFNGSIENGGTFRDDVDIDRQFLAPVLRWTPATGTAVTVEAEWLSQSRPFTATGGIYEDSGLVAVSPETNLGSQYDFRDVEETNFTGRLDQRLGNRWSAAVTIQHLLSDSDGRQTYSGGLDPDGRTLQRYWYHTIDDATQTYATVDLFGGFELGRTSHEVLIGAEFGEVKYGFEYFSGDSTPIDIFAPTPTPRIDEGDPLFLWDERDPKRGIYFQDHITVGDRLHLLAGLRHDEVSFKYRFPPDTTFSSTDRNEAWSPRFGVTYELKPGWSAYGSYSRSFTPELGLDNEGRPFEPERGMGLEVGTKLEIGRRLTATLAAFEVTRENVLTRDPTSPAFYVQVGEQQSRGLEFDLAGAIRDGWNVITSFSFTNAEITREKRYPVGTKLPSAPETTASLWTTYRFDGSFARGLTLGGGVFYLGRRNGDLAAPFDVPTATTIDLMARYPIGAFELGLNLRNATNEKYFESVQSRTNLQYGQPRSLVLSLSYRRSSQS